MLQFIACDNYRYDNKYFISNWYINNKILVLNKIIKVYENVNHNKKIAIKNKFCWIITIKRLQSK